MEKTRMHSRRMRTIRCSGCLMGGVCLGVSVQVGCLPGGWVSAQGWCLPRWASACLPRGVHPLWTEFLTHACESITFRLQTVNGNFTVRFTTMQNRQLLANVWLCQLKTVHYDMINQLIQQIRKINKSFKIKSSTMVINIGHCARLP